MKTPYKILLDAATLFPIVYIVGFVIFVFSMVLTINSGHGSGRIAFPPFLFPGVFLLHLFTILLGFGLATFYIVHAVKREDLKPEMKVIWAVLLLMGGIIAFPIYFFLYIWPSDPPPSDPPPPAGLGDWRE